MQAMLRFDIPNEEDRQCVGSMDPNQTHRALVQYYTRALFSTKVPNNEDKAVERRAMIDFCKQFRAL